jgi:hypothetical protein
MKRYNGQTNLQFMLLAPPRCTMSDGPYHTPPPEASTEAPSCQVFKKMSQDMRNHKYMRHNTIHK